VALLQYDIKVVGKESVDRALAGIEARLRQHNATVGRISGDVGGARRAGTAPATAQRRFQSSAAQHFKEVDRDQKKAIADEAKLKTKGLRDEHRVRNQINSLNIRELKKEERLRASMATRDERIIRRQARARSEFAQATIGHGVGRAAGTIKAVGAAGAGLLGVGGAGLAATAVAGATRLDDKVRRLIISGRQGGEISKYHPEELSKQFQRTGIETGLDPEAVAGGVQAFVTKTGDIETAIKNHKTFAKVAQATGAAVEDVASAAADMSEKMGIKSVEQMQEALATLTLQGKKGAFELKDAAQQLPEILADAASFGIKGNAGLTQLGGFLQIARQATGSGAETATATSAAFRQLKAKSADIQSGGAFSGRAVQVFEGGDPTKPLRDFNEILGDVISASRGNLVQLQEVFDVRGIRAVNPLITTFRNASEAAGGGDKGAKAGRAAVIGQLKEAATVKGGFGEIEKDSAAAMQSFAVQMSIVEMRFKQAMAGELLPQLIKLGPEIGKLVPYVGRATKMFVDLVSFLLAHPFQAVAIIVATQLAADFAKARLGNLVGGLIGKAFMGVRTPAAGAVGGGVGGGGGGGAAPTGGFLRGNPGLAGAASAAGAGLALGLTIGSAIITANVVNFEAGEAQMKSSGELLNKIREMNSPEQAKEARKLVEEQRVVVGDTKKTGVFESIASAVMPDSWAHSMAQTVGTAASDTEVKTQESFLAEMEMQLRKLNALEDIAKRLSTAGVSQEAAAVELSAAAKKLGLASPNRGNTPSPVGPAKT